MLRVRHPVSLFLIFILVMIGVLRSYSTPSVVGADAPDVEFSAIRAEAILRGLVREGVPHIAGSPENRKVRDRVAAQLSAAGYTVRYQSRYHCNALFGSCSPVENLIAVKPGSGRGDAVMLTAHYDSAWAGPGAADDGAGTAAVLEIARMVAEFPPFRNDIVFLISDGEENGLIGADAFAKYHPLFERVKAVIDLEARGAAGPSVMFETGEGNRRVIRMFAKNVSRPVGNSLAYEMYKRMPNDTDYTVYRNAGVMGLNFAFVDAVALYHSAIDDPDHLDLGSLQHHGDNAWAMLKAFARRDMHHLVSNEDAGYIDVFASRLIHYPVGISAGLTLVLGVWVMLAIAVAFHKEFRYRQLRWGLLAVPFLLVVIPLGAWLLSWPLGRWPDIHPLQHPHPWVGRLTLLGWYVLAVYLTLKLFTRRVSACAWMVLGWGVIFLLGLWLAEKMPAASYISMLPLAAFAVGTVFDLFRRKSPAPLLVSSVLGFAAAAFIALYHFFMLEVVANFDRSHLLLAPLGLAGLTAMPMLLAFARDLELSWKPAQWALAALLAGCVIQQFLPGYTPQRPRGMSLVYSEVEGGEQAWLGLESPYGNWDRRYAESHSFELQSIDSGRLRTVERPVRAVQPLNLPGAVLEERGVETRDGGFLRKLSFELPGSSPVLWLTLPLDSGLQKAWVNGELALDTAIESKHKRKAYMLRLVYPPGGHAEIELLTGSGQSLPLAAVTWHDLPAVISAPFMGNWPDDAQPFGFGSRAEKIQSFTLMAVAP